MSKWCKWIAVLMVFTLLVGCSNVGDYVKDHYNLVKADGKESNMSKVYSVEGKKVPEVSKELANEQKPKEMSKESDEQMFLLYNDQVINVQKDPKNENNTLVEINTIEYAKEHYNSSFLQTFLTAAALQSVLGGGWFNSNSNSSYKGYSSTPQQNRQQDSGSTDKKDSNTPSTSDRKGSFDTGKKDTGSSSRKNDGSAPKTKSDTGSKPGTSGRSGSFSTKKK
ncbi:DUF4247 domain-containing protein [Paenibacillus larvae]